MKIEFISNIFFKSLIPKNMYYVNGSKKDWLVKLTHEIHKRIVSPSFMVQDLVKPMMTSRTQLYSRIKKMTGLTPNQYIQKIRLEKAHQLILSNEYNSLHQIVDEVGFKRLEDFKSLYIRTYNCSPSMIFEELWGSRLKALILQKLTLSNYTVEDLIHDMTIDRKLLYKRTKKITKLSPGRYIRKLRLEKAKELIEKGEANSVKEVAESVGFQRTDYFSNLYEAHYNYRPLEYLQR